MFYDGGLWDVKYEMGIGGLFRRWVFILVSWFSEPQFGM